MGPRPTFAGAFRFWAKLGFISFGGPTGQIAIMRREPVEKKKWIREPQFLRALNSCMLLPGPEATQLATYVGWLLHGTRGVNWFAGAVGRAALLGQGRWNRGVVPVVIGSGALGLIYHVATR